jgi:hypothetical protein
LSRGWRTAILSSERQGAEMSNEAKTLIEQARALPLEEHRPG